jgi:hypothetical protein
MAALLDILYLTVPGAYLKDDTPAVGATRTGGSETGEVGSGEGMPGGELRAPPQATTKAERRYQHALRPEIVMYSRLMLIEENKQPPAIHRWRLSY